MSRRTRPQRPRHIVAGDQIGVRWGRWVDYPVRGWAVDAAGYTAETVDSRGWSYDEGLAEWCAWIGPATRVRQSDVLWCRPAPDGTAQGTLW